MVKKQKYNEKLWAGILLAQFLLFYLLSKSETAVNVFNTFFEVQKTLHQNIFSIVGISIGDLFYGLFLLTIIICIYSLFTKSKRKKYCSLLFIVLNIFYFLYQLFWGMLYFQDSLLTKLPEEDPTLEEAKILAEKYLNLSLIERRKVRSNKDGIFKIDQIKEIKQEIISSQKNLPSPFNQKRVTEIVSIKPSLLSNIMSYSGILGYYNPFTAEAQYNNQLPATYLPFTIAHESAHQLGYAREQEANFIGFLIGTSSRNPEIRYSTYLFALKQLLKQINSFDPEFTKTIQNNYSQEMKNDLNFERKFMIEHRSVLDEILRTTNDAFLKLNQQEGSITYSYFVDLLIRYERKNGTFTKQKNRVSQRDSKNTNDEKKFITF